MDPMAEHLNYSASYTYCKNDPIRFWDNFGNKPKSRIEYRGNGVFGINLNNLSRVTRNNYLRKNEDPRYWKDNCIGIGTTIATVRLNSFYPDIPMNNSYIPGPRPEHLQTIEDHKYKAGARNWTSVPMPNSSSSAKAASALFIAIDLTIAAYTSYEVFSINSDLNAIEEQMTLLEIATEFVNFEIKKGNIPQEYLEEKEANSIGALINFVFQGQNTTDDKRIEILGSYILFTIGRYDEENKRFKPLIEK